MKALPARPAQREVDRRFVYIDPTPERASFARYSTPFFLHFNPDFLIRTMPQYVDAAHPDQFAGRVAERRRGAGLELRQRDVELGAGVLVEVEQRRDGGRDARLGAHPGQVGPASTASGPAASATTRR